MGEALGWGGWGVDSLSVQPRKTLSIPISNRTPPPHFWGQKTTLGSAGRGERSPGGPNPEGSPKVLQSTQDGGISARFSEAASCISEPRKRGRGGGGGEDRVGARSKLRGKPAQRRLARPSPARFADRWICSGGSGSRLMNEVDFLSPPPARPPARGS